uniref:Uncharacterized protein n=1 Tax=Thermosporothrix sp. COM3 TaxID=2490863 RepID=A0A455SMR1_9CHLR|nr:hypothetical protein KTC_32220 [Thermosporothrix sp. COM3]
MADSILDSNRYQQQEAAAQLEENAASRGTSRGSGRTGIIWTPRFIISFGVIAILWLSCAGVIAHSWLNGYRFFRSDNRFLLGQTALLLVVWAVFFFVSRRSWGKLAAVFGIVWSAFLVAGVAIKYFVLPVDGSVGIYLDTMSSVALLGAFVCLSLNRVPVRRWDTIFFGLALIGSILLFFYRFWKFPEEARTLENMEAVVSTLAIYLSICVWWLRPSCWRFQPGPALLFGMVAVLTVMVGKIHSHPELVFFFQQTVYLVMLLGQLRLIQGELKQ